MLTLLSLTIMVWVQASFITQNGLQFLSHLMKNHDLGIIQPDGGLEKEETYSVSGNVTNNIARI
jgi:hypothetical protein